MSLSSAFFDFIRLVQDCQRDIFSYFPIIVFIIVSAEGMYRVFVSHKALLRVHSPMEFVISLNTGRNKLKRRHGLLKLSDFLII